MHKAANERLKIPAKFAIVWNFIGHIEKNKISCRFVKKINNAYSQTKAFRNKIKILFTFFLKTLSFIFSLCENIPTK